MSLAVVCLNQPHHILVLQCAHTVNLTGEVGHVLAVGGELGEADGLDGDGLESVAMVTAPDSGE